MAYNRFHTEVGKQFSLKEKIEFYKKRMKDNSLPGSKRLFAEQRFKELSLRGNVPVKAMEFYLVKPRYKPSEYQRQVLEAKIENCKAYMAKDPKNLQFYKDRLTLRQKQLEGLEPIDPNDIALSGGDQRKRDEQVNQVVEKIEASMKGWR